METNSKNCKLCNRKDNSKQPWEISEDPQKYEKAIKKFADTVYRQGQKNKILLIVDGAGISTNAPFMGQMMKKLGELITDNGKKKIEENFSQTFQDIYNGYFKIGNSTEYLVSDMIPAQLKLLTYVQNAYLSDKRAGVEEKDREELKSVWETYISWLMGNDSNDIGNIPAVGDDFKGIRNVPASCSQKLIAKMYREMNAISLTTNFDNLMKKAFEENNKEESKAGTEKKNESNEVLSFYPLLDVEDFDKFFVDGTSEEEAEKNHVKQVVEIQTRGDIFWIRCSGEKNRTCSNIGRQCYVPNTYEEIRDGKVYCRLCGSPAEIYFAYPGTKEKERSMSTVMGCMWKFLAYRCGAVIVAGSSMNYDPVLLNFLIALLERKGVPLLYISRLRNNNGVSDDKNPFHENAATNAFFIRGKDNKDHIWVCAKDASFVLNDIRHAYQQLKKSKDKDLVKKAEDNKDEYKTKANQYIKLAKKVIEINELEEYPEDLGYIEKILPIPVNNEIKALRNYSQLGLKTYWLFGEERKYKFHNRYRHSLGVTMIASAVYLSAKKNKASDNELHFLQIAALLHDLGHLPFSHLIEEIFGEFGWIPPGESQTFTHEQNTKKQIKQLMENNALKSELEETGYTLEDLLYLIEGKFGVGYMDAIINGPVDADKIQYIFADSTFLKMNDPDIFEKFLIDFCSELSVTKHKFLYISGVSSKKALELIKMRVNMYDTVYLRDGLRYLEACCKLIVKTFISYLCADITLFNENSDDSSNDKSSIQDKNTHIYNLAGKKINKVMEWIKATLNEKSPEDPVCERFLINKMFCCLRKNKILSDELIKALKFCVDKINNTTTESDVQALEKKYIKRYSLNEEGYSKKALDNITKTFYLRFKGVILIDFVKSKSAFSFSEAGKREKRIDGSNAYVESVLIDSMGDDKNKIRCFGDSTGYMSKKLSIPSGAHINIYKITDESYSYTQALDYIEDLLRKENLIQDKEESHE